MKRAHGSHERLVNCVSEFCVGRFLWWEAIDQRLSDLGNNVWLQSSDFDPTASYYDIEVASSASMVTITSS